MKLLLLLAFCISAGAQEYSIDSVIENLIRQESSNGLQIYGDKDSSGNYRAIGCLQLWKCRVDDINRICKLKGYSYRFTYKDRLSRKKSILMCRIALIDFIERHKRIKGKMPNEYVLAHSWKYPYWHSIKDFKYIKDYKTKKEI